MAVPIDRFSRAVTGQVKQHAQWLARAQQGDAAAFERLIADHVPSVRRFARSMCKDVTLADDIAQDALLKAYQSIRGYRFQAAFSTWLFRIVKNVLIDHARSAHERRRGLSEPLDHDADQVPCAEPGPESDLSRRQLRQRLWAALSTLPLEYRSAVVLFDVEGFSQEEVAAIERVATGTVKSRLSRGRKLLRQALHHDRQSAMVGNETVRRSVPPGRSLS